MTKINGSFLTLCIIAFLFSSCKQDYDKNVNEWKKQNTMAFQQIANNPQYQEIKSPGNEGSIYYKVLKKGEGTSQIYFTSIVSLFYKGTFVTTNNEMNITDKTIISQRTKDNDYSAAKFQVRNGGTQITEGNLLRGIQVALQHMVKGDIWEVWIPYQLAYATTTAQHRVPAYSTVRFEIEVVDVEQ